MSTENVIGSQLARIEELDRLGKSKILLPKGMTIDDLKKWVPEVIESLQKENIYERKDKREGKVFKQPFMYAITDSNMYKGALLDGVRGQYNQDIGSMVYNEIVEHGRQTIDELVEHISGIEKPLLVLVINKMISDNYIEHFKEDDGTKTLEWVDDNKRTPKLQGRKKKSNNKINDKSKIKRTGKGRNKKTFGKKDFIVKKGRKKIKKKLDLSNLKKSN